MADLLRLAVAALILVLLARTVRPAWQQRDLALRVWGGIRPRHAAGALVLMLAVVSVAVGLITLVPVTGWGLGTPLGLSGNAVFAPLEEVSVRTGGGGLATPAPDGQPLVVLLVTGAFLAGLVLLFPWLAYVEERGFREGLETASLGRQAWIALRFGLLHLVMLIPLAAALAVAVAGFGYGLVYRRAYRRREHRLREELVAAPAPAPLLAAATETRVRALARADAVLESTRWHTTFNSLVVLVVGLALLLGA